MSDKATQLTGFLAEKLPKMLFMMSVVATFATAALFFQNPKHFFFTYLTSYTFFLTLTLGALFFVIIQFLVRAGWSVTLRRIPEHLMKNMGLMALLFLPILLGLGELYHWTHADAVIHDHLLQGKAPYLNIPFFLVRTALYFVVWLVLVHLFYKGSVAQDKSGDKAITLRLQAIATVGVLLYAVTQSFAFIDWLMSLTPHWFSTIWGIYLFAGSCVISIAIIILIALLLRRFGFMSDVITVEHYHDLGKLLYGFNIFWAYIAFSQFLLIWYANIPEETHWYLEHFSGNWKTISTVIAIGHFFVPLLLFISRHAKRNLRFNATICIWFVFMHFLELYWIIMPNLYKDGVAFRLIDLTCFLAIAGLYFGFFFKRLSTTNLYPIQDPRLEESLRFKNQ